MFNLNEFLEGVDSVREHRRISWKQVARESGVSASTISRAGEGSNVSVENLVKLAVWSGSSIDDYIEGSEPSVVTIGKVIMSIHQTDLPYRYKVVLARATRTIYQLLKAEGLRELEDNNGF